VHTVHVEDTRRDDVSEVRYQWTEHRINDHKISIGKQAPTNGNPVARVVEIIGSESGNVTLEFDADGFELLKAILNQY
jgi:hypothetical protein